MSATIDVLYLPDEVAERLLERARDAYPGEACGFLIGSVEERAARVRAARAERNRAVRNDRFLIDAADVFAAMRAARTDGDEIIGVYHSHPDGAAEPSATDRADAWGGWLHVIVACPGGSPERMKCWRDAGDRFDAVEIVAVAA